MNPKSFARALWVTAAVLTAAGAGCASRQPATESLVSASEGSVVFGTFVSQGEAKLTPRTPLTDLHAVGDGLYAYTQNNIVYSLSPGLELRFLKQVVPPDEGLRPPVQVGEETIFPSTKGMFVLGKTGEPIRTIKLTNPLSSDVHVDQRGMLLAGVAGNTGGRVAVIDPQKSTRASVQETLIGNVRSAPVALQGIVFAATDTGRVYAVGLENRTAWSLDDMSFATGRPIEADLVIDDYALYVASTDLKLYALDRSTGKIKWRYAAEVPLTDTPLVTKDRVYQVVPGKGLASIDKIDGKLYREPLWVTPNVTRVVSADDKYVYGVEGNDRLVAIGITDGVVRFSAQGAFDFVTASGDSIFAASKDGRVVKLKRGPYTGDAVAGVDESVKSVSR